MIYVTGDTHGIQAKFRNEIHPVLKAEDIVIILGDFGVGFWEEATVSEDAFYDWISEQNYIVLFVDGNHCNFSKLYDYPQQEWKGGKVHKIRHNLFHLMRGEIFEIEGKTLFTFGGGYSLDQPFRKENVSWWPQEMPSEEEYQNGLRNLEKHNFNVDYILTHTAPSETVKYMSIRTCMRIKGNVVEEMPLTAYLQKIMDSTQYKKHYFGHFHIDMDLWKDEHAVFNSVRELESGKIVKEWLTYEE